MENIKAFCEKTGCKLSTDEQIGFGRDCVGILEPSQKGFLCYWDYLGDPEQGHEVAMKNVPSGAYHKDAYLAILTEEHSTEEATKLLDEWVGHIIKSDYQIKNVRRPTLSAMMGNGTEPLLVNK